MPYREIDTILQVFRGNKKKYCISVNMREGTRKQLILCFNVTCCINSVNNS